MPSGIRFMALTSSLEAGSPRPRIEEARGVLGVGELGLTFMADGLPAWSGYDLATACLATVSRHRSAAAASARRQTAEAGRPPGSALPTARRPRTAGNSAIPSELDACTTAPKRSVREIPIVAAIGPASR